MCLCKWAAGNIQLWGLWFSPELGLLSSQRFTYTLWVLRFPKKLADGCIGYCKSPLGVSAYVHGSLRWKVQSDKWIQPLSVGETPFNKDRRFRLNLKHLNSSVWEEDCSRDLSCCYLNLQVDCGRARRPRLDELKGLAQDFKLLNKF